MSPAVTMDAAAADRAILDAADRLFYARGIGGVGMDDVRDEAGVSLRRLYARYPSKRDLVAAWLEDRHGRWMAWFTAVVDRRCTDGSDPLLATFDAITEWAATPGYRGCAFLNAIAEPSDIDDAHRAIVANHKQALTEHLASLAGRTGRSGPSWLPGAIGVLIDGAIVRSVALQSTEPINDARRAASRILESLNPT